MVVNAFFQDKETGILPSEYSDYKLCMEWGISWNEFLATPDYVIEEIKEYRLAESEGTQRAKNINAAKNKLKEMKK